MKLKKHESPRKMGRNDKSKLSAAKLRQIKKRNKLLLENLR
jgi:hypothetical protein